MNYKRQSSRIEIDSKLWTDFKSHANEKGLDVQNFMEDLLKKEIRQNLLSH